MKSVLLAAALISTLTANAQQQDATTQQQVDAMNYNMQVAHRDMQRATRIQYVAFGTLVLGSVSVVTGFVVKEKAPKYVGTGLIAVSIVLSAIAPGYMHRAGVRLAGDQLNVDLPRRKKTRQMK